MDEITRRINSHYNHCKKAPTVKLEYGKISYSDLDYLTTEDDLFVKLYGQLYVPRLVMITKYKKYFEPEYYDSCRVYLMHFSFLFGLGKISDAMKLKRNDVHLLEDYFRTLLKRLDEYIDESYESDEEEYIDESDDEEYDDDEVEKYLANFDISTHRYLFEPKYYIEDDEQDIKNNQVEQDYQLDNNIKNNQVEQDNEDVSTRVNSCERNVSFNENLLLNIPHINEDTISNRDSILYLQNPDTNINSDYYCNNVDNSNSYFQKDLDTADNNYEVIQDGNSINSEQHYNSCITEQEYTNCNHEVVQDSTNNCKQPKTTHEYDCERSDTSYENTQANYDDSDTICENYNTIQINYEYKESA